MPAHVARGIPSKLYSCRHDFEFPLFHSWQSLCSWEKKHVTFNHYTRAYYIHSADYLFIYPHHLISSACNRLMCVARGAAFNFPNNSVHARFLCLGKLVFSSFGHGSSNILARLSGLILYPLRRAKVRNFLNAFFFRSREQQSH